MRRSAAAPPVAEIVPASQSTADAAARLDFSGVGGAVGARRAGAASATPARPAAGEQRDRAAPRYSHSIVAGGFDEMS